MKNPSKPHKQPPKSQAQPDSASRMDSPLSGNEHQRKNQVQSIARGVFDGVERNTPDDPDDLEDSNYQPEIRHSNVMNTAKDGSHSHTVHHPGGHSETHHVMPGEDYPACR